jgi:hypothetical protein
MGASVAATVAILFVISFSVWSGLSFRKLAHNTLACDSPRALRLDAERRGTVFGAFFVSSLIGFAVIPMVKALLLVKGLFQETWLTWIAFGNARAENNVERFGYAGAALALTGLFCLYQYIRSMHHRQMLYALDRFLDKTDIRAGIEPLAKAWREAAAKLGFVFESPFYLTIRGHRRDVVGFLPHFGSVNGMVVDAWISGSADTTRSLLEAAQRADLFCSCVNADTYDRFDEKVFIDALNDWGYFGPENLRPEWAKRGDTDRKGVQDSGRQ